MPIPVSLGKSLDRLRANILQAEKYLSKIPGAEDAWAMVDETSTLVFTEDNDGELSICVARFDNGYPDYSSARPILELSVSKRKIASACIPELIKDANGQLERFQVELDETNRLLEELLNDANGPKQAISHQGLQVPVAERFGSR